MGDAELKVKISGVFESLPVSMKYDDTFANIESMKFKTSSGWANITIGSAPAPDWVIESLYAVTWSSMEAIDVDPYPQAQQAKTVCFNPTGNKIYIAHWLPSSGSSCFVKQFTTTSPWNLNLANISYDEVYLDVSDKVTTGAELDLKFSSDGSKLYVHGMFGSDDNIHQYVLSTPWDLSTASFDSTFDLGVASNFGAGIIGFKTDGKRMYVPSSNLNKINEYTLSSAWDISTATLTTSHDISALSLYPASVNFNPNGKQLFLGFDNVLNECSLSTAWDLSTISFVKSISIDTSYFGFEDTPYVIGVTFSPDHTKAYGICALYWYDEMMMGDQWCTPMFEFDIYTE